MATVDWPGGVVWVVCMLPPPQAITPERPVASRSIHNAALAAPESCFLRQRSSRAANAPGIQPRNIRAGVKFDGPGPKSGPRLLTVPVAGPVVVRVSVLVCGLFDPSAVSVAGLKAQLARLGNPVQAKVSVPE